MGRKTIVLILVCLSLFLFSCKSNSADDEGNQPDNPIIDNPPIDHYYEVIFASDDGTIIGKQMVKEGEDVIFPSNPSKDYYQFVAWNHDGKNIHEDLIIKAIFEPVSDNFSITFVIEDQYWYYQSKEEMTLAFLNDFYDFVSPNYNKEYFIYGGTESFTNGSWKTFLGGSMGNNNKLLFHNDIDEINEAYFANSERYKTKWYPLFNYVSNQICKLNQRFGNPAIAYTHGALDFYRYLVDDPATYIATYGGADVFYGLPSFDAPILLSTYNYYSETITLPIPASCLFAGWYKDEDFMDGPYDAIAFGSLGNLTFYAKILTEPLYTLSFVSQFGEEYADVQFKKGMTLELPVLYKEGFEFKGWYYDNVLLNGEVHLDYPCDVYLEAYWKDLNNINLEKLVYDGNVVVYRNTNIAVVIPDTYVEKEEEFRAAWVSSFTSCFVPSTDVETMKANLTEVLDILEYYNFNAIIFHLRTHNNAFYKTKLAPIDPKYGTYESFEQWDYLEWFIGECQQRHIAFHAWLNPYRIQLSGYSMDFTTTDVAKLYLDTPLNPASKPDNILMTYPNSSTSVKLSQGAILNPCKKEVQDYLIAVIEEIINHYDVDGIHFDDYFYTRLSSNPNICYDADQGDYLQYLSDNEISNAEDDEEIKGEWRRNNINQLIYRVHHLLQTYNQQKKTHIQFGIAPSSIYKTGDGTVEGGLNVKSGQTYGKYLYCDSLKW
ncbi:MAG TPA: family 10 glycosylhydrolase, partial [Bacilli bacterium]|nr:family 10 glycosylhydrolase [Bacilli bacterium]